MALTRMMEINPSENSLFVFYGCLFCVLQDRWVNLCHVSVYPEFNHFQLLKIRVHLKNVGGPSLMGGAVYVDRLGIPLYFQGTCTPRTHNRPYTFYSLDKATL
ncbi:hypothetical protein DSO57_1014192 [Entomophthora muscae]|uniref:Uncharacterized protein n=1 Tax=Entomophthora muscae TaxID=34485 RepID=A0ACC2T5V6_9FUNG|nr:hypothetical protein DSO57_1014192 [Entomophthora muscae]